ncbi:ABC transporter ATP-binding protein [Mailhella massiliensis]|uniref:ABC transporter ATP-binding protein n=1 Tax=Mailhella massiliensis TaxID=1903261 RepID=UPI0023543AFD|nr:ATP-binding cassette domain-containing protein [Mailhella massiliensis]
MDNALYLKNIRYSVQDGAGMRRVLDIPELSLPGGTLAGIYGDSGSGKTSLLNILCGLILPDECKGREIRWGKDELCAMPEGARDAWRGRHVGMIFQDFQLFPQLSAMENVLLPATFRRFSLSDELRGRARDLLRRLGIRNLDAEAGVFSRGEQQRVAMARAVLFRPSVLLADEPTASLDRSNAQLVTDELVDLARSEGCTLLVVTHEQILHGRMDVRFRLERGRLLSGLDDDLKVK